VVLQQLPQHLRPRWSRTSSISQAVSTAAAGPASSEASALNMSLETANGSSGGTAQYTSMRGSSSVMSGSG
jgi:hypothetical protein